MKDVIKHFFFFVIGITIAFSLIAQPAKKTISLKDSLDSKFDMSDFIIDAHGFVPIPYLITEPAFGGFGGALIPVFIKKRPPYTDTIKGKVKVTQVAPDITGGIGLYTANKTYGILGFRSGTIIKSRIKYLVGGGYVHLNLSFFKTFPHIGEKELAFTINTIPAILQAIKRIGYSHWYAGFRYLYLKTDMIFNGDSRLKPLLDSADFNKIISQFGIVVEMDRRDNVFTPDRGLKIHFDLTRSDDFIGSDYDFWKLNYYNYWYQPFSGQTVLGVRFDLKQSFGEVPFYALPFIEMRGIPIARYQGKVNLLTELELRQDIKYRWSAIGFGGTAKAFDYWDAFKNSDWVFSYGAGFRYLIARKFKLRTGIDIARGAGGWAYYIVFGSNWAK